MAMADAVQELAATTPGKESLAIESFAIALRQLPTAIADNAGYDSSELVSQLRALHSKGQHTMGLGQSVPVIVCVVGCGLFNLLLLVWLYKAIVFVSY